MAHIRTYDTQRKRKGKTVRVYRRVGFDFAARGLHALRREPSLRLVCLPTEQLHDVVRRLSLFRWGGWFG